MPSDTRNSSKDSKGAFERYPLWTYGCNDHLGFDPKDQKELPEWFEPTGQLKQDFPKVCQLLGITPHPAFKLPRQAQTRPSMSMTRRHSVSGRRASIAMIDPAEAAAQAAAAAALQSPVLAVRSVLLDQASMAVLALLAPGSQHLRQIQFSDCRLDCDMLRLLRRGLEGSSTVESLQIEWNAVELPLPSPEEMEAAAASGQAADAATANKGGASGAGGDAVGVTSFEARERRRYTLQTRRCLRALRRWLSDLGDRSRNGGGLEATLAALEAAQPADQALSAGEFHDLLEGTIGAAGPQVTEAFDALDGPDFGGGAGRVSVGDLRRALEADADVEAAEEKTPGDDPVGAALAIFVDGTCTLEGFSLRACAVGLPEVSAIAQAISRSPWQLRSLNLWDNRLCDRCASALATALEAYRGLEYLGLGKNRITDGGLAELCRPFHAVNLDEAGKKAAQDRIKEQEAGIAKASAAKAKAKAKAEPKGGGADVGGRLFREPSPFVDELEERPPVLEGGEPSYLLRRPSELKMLMVSENPIKHLRTIEALQPLGPRGAELVIKQTAAASALMAKRTELTTKERRPFCPGGEGWVVRAA